MFTALAFIISIPAAAAVPSIRLSGGYCGLQPDPESNAFYTPKYKTPNGRWAYQSDTNKHCWLYYDGWYTKCNGDPMKGWLVGCHDDDQPRQHGGATDLVSGCSKAVTFAESGMYPPNGEVTSIWMWCGTYGHAGASVTFTTVGGTSDSESDSESGSSDAPSAGVCAYISTASLTMYMRLVLRLLFPAPGSNTTTSCVIRRACARVCVLDFISIELSLELRAGCNSPHAIECSGYGVYDK